MADLVLRGGRVIDPGSGRDETGDIAFGEGKVAALGHDLAGDEVVDARGLLVVPGLIDLHTMSIGVAPRSVSMRPKWRSAAERRPSSTLAAPVPAISTAFAVMSSTRRRCA